MKKAVITLVVFLTIHNSSIAQVQVSNPVTGNVVVAQNEVLEENEILSRYLRGLYSNTSSNIEGSPYLFDEYKNGKILFKDKVLAGLLKYNVAREEIQVLLKNQEYILQDGMEVEIEGKTYRKLEYKRDGKDFLGYFEVLTKTEAAPVLLLKKDLKKVRPGQAAGAMRPAKSPQYVDQSSFYLQIENSRPFEVKSRKKPFLKSLPKDHQEKIKAFIAENKLSPRNQEDLIKIVEYYNSIF